MTKNISEVVQEEDKNLTNKSLPLKIILGVLLGVVLIGLIAKIILVKFYLPSPQSNNTPNTSLTPTPIVLPIFQGKGTYNISQGKTKGPKISKAIIDPHDPKVGTTQKMTIFVQHTAPVLSVKVTLNSDNNQADTYNLALSEGTNLDGQWTGSWTISNTHLQTYGFVINASDGINDSRAGISIR